MFVFELGVNGSYPIDLVSPTDTWHYPTRDGRRPSRDCKSGVLPARIDV